MAQEYYDPWSNTKTVNGLDADLVISALQKCIRRAEEDTGSSYGLRALYDVHLPRREDVEPSAGNFRRGYRFRK